MSSAPEDRSEAETLDDTESALVDILDRLERENVSVEEVLRPYPEALAETLRRRLTLLGALDLDPTPPKLRIPLDHGAQLGDYELIEKLGRGGMGEIWLARQKSLQRNVALKLIRSPLAQDAPAELRFEREALALAKLSHPNIVRVLQSGETDGVLWIAMEYLPGRDLDTTVKEDGADVRQIVTWSRDIARALQAAHDAGLVHRDVKPSNIRITPEGKACLLDFGLTRGVGRESLSTTGGFVGSPHYAAPEQVRGERDAVGPACDVYGLGVTLYELLGQRPPFEASTTEQLFHAILSREAKPLRRLNPGVSRDLENVVAKSMEKNRQRRYLSAAAFADDLDAILGVRSVRARAPSWARRIGRFVRRRPAISSGVAVLVAAMLFVGISMIVNDARERRAAREKARHTILQAETWLEDFARESEELPRRLVKFESEKRFVESKWMPPAKLQEFDASLRSIEKALADRELVFAKVLGAVTSARDLDPEVEGADRLRARVYYHRWRVARAAQDRNLARFWAKQVEETDKKGDIQALVQPDRVLNLITDPPGARVDLFILRRHDKIVTGGEPRRIAVPHLPGELEYIGRETLRVLDSRGDLQAEDHVISLEGVSIEGAVFVAESDETFRLKDRVVAMDGVKPAHVSDAEDLWPTTRSVTIIRDGERIELPIEKWWRPRLVSARGLVAFTDCSAELLRDGEKIRTRIPRGTRLRHSASPLLTGAETLIGKTPIVNADLPFEDVVILIRKDGYRSFRLSLPEFGVIELNKVVPLAPLSEIPEPFIRVQTYNGRNYDIMDREVTVREYRTFLDDPEILERIRDQESKFVPTHPKTWEPGPDGKFLPPEGVPDDWPICGISWEAADAFAKWKTEGDRAQGATWRYVLPDWSIWQTMSECSAAYPTYHWGDHFRHGFAKSCFASRTPRVEPVLRYPIDETPTGLYDIAGSVSEYCEGWFWKEQNQRPACGGSWANGQPIRFRPNSAIGLYPDRAYGPAGLRLQLIRD